MSPGAACPIIDMDAAPIPTDSAGAATVSAEQSLLNDLRHTLAVLNWARNLVLRRLFGVPREQAKLLTFVLR